MKRKISLLLALASIAAATVLAVATGADPLLAQGKKTRTPCTQTAQVFSKWSFGGLTADS